MPADDAQAAVLTTAAGATNGAVRDNAVPTSRWPVLLAIALGVVIILGVGFGPGLAHNAAHDTRHTLSFPCH